jgi:hypothetical protein
MEIMRQNEVVAEFHEPSDAFAPDRPQWRAPSRASTTRLTHACVAAALGATLLVSLWLRPDPRGLGTHEQILIWPCNFHLLTAMPCPFCGMTTAFAHMARGQLHEAVMAQPMGALGFLVCLVALPVFVGAAISGKDLLGALSRLPLAKLSWVVVATLAAAWIFKLAMALQH